MEQKKFNLWNRIVAMAVFVISAVTYLATIEPTASFWDCGEFIASSYKLEVGHPPGNPVFQLIARFFTMFTGAEHAAVAVNAMSAICSALTIFFLYLTIVFFAKRLLKPREDGTWGPVRRSPSSAPVPSEPWPTPSPTLSGSPRSRARSMPCPPCSRPWSSGP